MSATRAIFMAMLAIISHVNEMYNMGWNTDNSSLGW